MNPFGEDRLMESLAAHSDGGNRALDDIAQGILGDIRGHVSGAEQYDDMTFLLLRVEA
jgi:serine phosphatase RsbU (regulator of sigma subunit)